MDRLPSVELWDQVRVLLKRASRSRVTAKTAEMKYEQACAKLKKQQGKLEEKKQKRYQTFLKEGVRAENAFLAAEAGRHLTDQTAWKFPYGEGSIKCAHVLLIHTHDFIMGNRGEWSRARVEAAVSFMLEGKIPKDVLVVFPQGFQKNNPTEPKENKEALGKNVANYYLECRKRSGEDPEECVMKILCRPMGWGTLEDILNAYRIVKDRGYAHARFYMVSDPTHLRRIRMVWNKTHPAGWIADFLPTPEPALSLFDRTLRECAARMLYRIKLRRIRFSL